MAKALSDISDALKHTGEVSSKWTLTAHSSNREIALKKSEKVYVNNSHNELTKQT